MKTRTRCLGGMGMTVVVCLALLAGCTYSTQGLFTKPSLTHCSRMAVLGLSEEQEQIFMASYLKTFPEQGITFVERGQLQRIITEQDLRAGRLNERTRARIKEILGVEALVLCAYYEAAPKSPNRKLRVRVVNSETGAIIGSVITEAGNNFTNHCYTATQALKADLKGEYGIGRQQANNEYTSPPRW